MLKTRTSKPPQQQNTTPRGKAPRPAAAPFSLADKQTAKRSRNASARFPARSPRVFCVFFEQRRRRRSPLLVVAHYQVGRSIGRRRARAQRAHHSFDGRSRACRARLAAMRGSVALRVRDHAARRVRLARLGRRHLAAAVPCQDTRFFPFASRHFHFALRTSEAGVKRNQPGRRTTRCSHTPSSIVRSYARNRVTDVTRRRNAVLVGGWAARPR